MTDQSQKPTPLLDSAIANGRGGFDKVPSCAGSLTFAP